ncbi:MAG: tRNA (adenosine(37)-N6)-threonylcarbamoyltransferase complex ATPase subunit type 1 TsaE [Gammaproteobacteria bacterium]|nr:tRNA (adenosine(37)-N6)-threonylcarbamoyltransferase complex ATPase subunit type 1 TsaE [Gammaproteobacteria bacterium]
MQIIDENAMTELGAKLAMVSVPGTIVYLDGDLGAGKTTLVRGFLRSQGYSGAVKSPTFTVVEPYTLDNNKFYNYNELEDDLKLDGDNNSVTHSISNKNTESDREQIESQVQRVYHFDLYRLEDPEELEYIGIRDYLDGHAIALVEWPEKGYGVLPQADLIIKITHQKQGRKVELQSHSEVGTVIVSKLVSNERNKSSI